MTFSNGTKNEGMFDNNVFIGKHDPHKSSHESPHKNSLSRIDHK